MFIKKFLKKKKYEIIDSKLEKIETMSDDELLEKYKRYYAYSATSITLGVLIIIGGIVAIILIL